MASRRPVTAAMFCGNLFNFLALATHVDPDGLDAVLARGPGDVQLLTLLEGPREDTTGGDFTGVWVHPDVGDHEDDLAVFVDETHRVCEFGVSVTTPDTWDTTWLCVDWVREVLTDHVEDDIRQRRLLVKFLALIGALEFHDLSEVHPGSLHRWHGDTPLVECRTEADGTAFDGDGPIFDVVHILGHAADEFVDVVDDRDETLLHLLWSFLEFRNQAVDLVNEQGRLDALAECLAQDRFGLWHGTLDSVDDDERTVDCTHRTRHVATEVDVARRIDQVDQVVGVFVLVGHRNVCRVDGNPTFLLVFFRVHRELFAGSLIRDHARTREEVVRKRCFSVVNVSGDGDVPDVLRFVHQPFTLLDDLLASAHIYPVTGSGVKRVVFRRRRK